jgi:PAS domain S-box-containing protein
VGQALALAAALIGLLTLGEYVFGWNPGIDQVLFREPPGAVGTAFPGRMALATLASFIALGGAVAMLNVRNVWVRRLSDLTLAAMSIFCLTTVVAYVYSTRSFYLTGGEGFTPMAFPTAVGFLVLAFGTRIARPTLGVFALALKKGPAGVIVRRLGPAAIASLLVLGYLHVIGERNGLTDPVGISLLVVGVIVIAIVSFEITARAVDRAESARLRVEDERQLFFGLSLDMLCLANLDGHFVQLNPAWEKTLGWNTQELMARPFIEFVHPDDREATIAETARLGLGAETVSFENRYRCKDGSYRWLLWSVAGVPERGLLIAAARDITERTHAEVERQRLVEEVREQAQRVSDLFNKAPVGYHSLGPDGLFLDINDTELAWLGYARDEVIGTMRFTDLTTPEGVRTFNEVFPVIKEQGYIRDREIEMVRKDGTAFPVLVNSTAITDEAGNFLRSRSTAVDITELKHAQSRLLEAKEEAERANRAKDGFLSRTSHELRTPLNAILGFAQLLEMDDLTEEQMGSTGRIVTAGRHLMSFVDEMLDISRIESGMLSLSMEPVEVSAVVRESLDIIRALADERGVTLRAQDDGGFHVMADRRRMQQVVVNLLSNAVKFNREGGEVKVTWELCPDERIRLHVEDQGPGIPADQMDRVFVPFDRLEAERLGVQGTGLGLALSQGLMEAMDGAIDVESVVGRGSVFTVSLASAEAPGSPCVESETSLQLAERTAEGRTVLHVDDNAVNLKLVERILGRLPGTTLLSAMHGRLGLELARKHRPDLILLDLHLPDMSGEEALRALRADPATSGIPVIMLSADAVPRTARELLDAGAIEYVTKPIDVPSFLQLVGGILGDG